MNGPALQWLFPKDSGTTVDLSESSEGTALFDTLLALKLRREEIEAQEAYAKQQLQNVMGQASTAVFAGGRVSWKRTKDRTIADLERLSLEQPELLKQYSKTVAGSRRFLLQTERSAS